jgi:outer membrane protein TolC
VRYFPLLAALSLGVSSIHAAEYVLTLREAVERALQQNPDVVLSKIEEEIAAQRVRLARDPFYPKIVAGTGLAYSTGYPLSIDGSPPAAVKVTAVQTFFNRTKTFQVAESSQNTRTTMIETQLKRDDVAYRTASLYLDAERLTRASTYVGKQIAEFERVKGITEERVKEGRELEINKMKSELDLARAKQRSRALGADRNYLERSLAIILGYNPDDAVKISSELRMPPDLPLTEQECVDRALANNKDIRRLESVLASKALVIKAQAAARLPQVDLVAQYALLTRYNYNEDFFRRFNRHAGQVGVSIQFPLMSGTGSSALGATATLESQRLRAEIRSTQGRVSLEARRSFEELQSAEAAEEVARLDLALASKQLELVEERLKEGRAADFELAQARLLENEKRIAFLESQSIREKARLNILKQTGSVLPALR